MDAESILVIFLSTALAFFLVLGIIFLVLLIDIAQRVRRITGKAEDLVDQAESAVEVIKNATVPIAISRLLAAVAGIFGADKNKEEKEE